MSDSTLPPGHHITTFPPHPLVHDLKCWPEYHKEVRVGRKRFEVRKADRDFKAGDFVMLREWDPKAEAYTGFWSLHRITYIVGGEHAIPGFAIFGLSDLIGGTTTSKAA